MEKYDFDTLKEYKKAVDDIEKVYGRRDKATMYHYLDTKGASMMKKYKRISIAMMVLGVILSPIILGIPLFIAGVVVFFMLKKGNRLMLTYREMIAEDETLPDGDSSIFSKP